MNITKSNSAGSLWHILNHILENNYIGSVGSLLVDAWGYEHSEETQAYGDTLALTSRVRSDARRYYTSNTENFIGGLIQIEEGLANFAPNENALELRPYINKSTLSNVAGLSQQVYLNYDESVVNDNDLDSLLTQTEEMLRLIVKSQIDSHLKRILVDNLEKLRSAIHDYRIFGTEGIRRATEQALGSILLARDPDETEEDIENIDQVVKLFETAYKLINWSGRIYNTVAPAFSLPQLPLPS